MELTQKPAEQFTSNRHNFNVPYVGTETEAWLGSSPGRDPSLQAVDIRARPPRASAGAEVIHEGLDAQKNQPRLRYDHALAAGLPIATGVIEGICRHLVKDRMDITGARWGLDRAEAILKLRSLKVSGDLNNYWPFHYRRKHERNYPSAPMPELFKEAA